MANENFFVHAYNFIRYDKHKFPDRKTPVKTFCGLTGYLDCNLYVRTPLSIPDSEYCKKDSEKIDHTAYPFFTVEGKPIIPGSEIRGLIRNIYEIITDSCFSVINSNMISARNITENTVPRNIGILYFNEADNRWVLYQADRYAAYTNTTKAELLKKFAGKKYIERDWALSVQLDTNMKKLKSVIDEAISKAETYNEFWDILEQSSDSRKRVFTVNLDDNAFGFIFESKLDKGRTRREQDLNNRLNSVNAEKKWGSQYSEDSLFDYFSMKKEDRQAYYDKYYLDPIINFSVFVPTDEKKTSAAELEKAVENLNAILDFSEMYANGDETTLKRIQKVRPSKDKGVPVFFRKENGRLILTPSHFSREVYNNTVESILADRKKCDDKNNLCPGCRLFGMIGKAQHAAVSHVRFTDAEVLGAYSLNEEYTTLKVLFSPKTTCWEFYADNKFDDANVTLRGRKMYFHNPLAKINSSVYSQQKKEKFNSSVQLMTKGTFSFRVYFDNISSDELRYLILALTLGENSPDSKLMHKLGHGKPLGLGSVKITVKNVVTRDLRNYKISSAPEYLEEIKTENPLKTRKRELPAGEYTLTDLLNICNFDFCDGFTVSYPVVEALPGAHVKDNDVASHRYFAWMANRTGFKNQEKQYECNSLPVIASTAEKMKMPVIVTDKDKKLKSKNTAYSGRTGVAVGLPKRNEVIKITLSKDAFPDKKGNGFVGYFYYNGYRGTAFELPFLLKKGTEITINVSGVKENNGTIFGNYKK